MADWNTVINTRDGRLTSWIRLCAIAVALAAAGAAGVRDLRRAVPEQQPDARGEGAATRFARPPEPGRLRGRLLLLPPEMVAGRDRPFPVGAQGRSRVHQSRQRLLLPRRRVGEGEPAGRGAPLAREAGGGVREERAPRARAEDDHRAQGSGSETDDVSSAGRSASAKASARPAVALAKAGRPAGGTACDTSASRRSSWRARHPPPSRRPTG